MSNKKSYEDWSAERKLMIQQGEVPEWMTTQGYIMFKKKYAFGDESVKSRFTTIAKTLSQYMPDEFKQKANDEFFKLMWTGRLAPSTPVYCNTGTNRGHSVSCSGGYIDDSIDGFYTSLHETAMLCKLGYGTSSYLGDIRPRGSKISNGGNADGTVPVFELFKKTASLVSQGNNRRGSWAGYLPIDHPDFDELNESILHAPDNCNIGYSFSDEFIKKLESGDKEAIRKYCDIMYLRSRFGKGYIWKPDTANRLAPECIQKAGITIKASNLCSEIALPQDKDHTFTCVLSSLNLSKWDEFEEDDIFWSLVFLDCVVSHTLTQTRDIPALERVTRFTEKYRAVGLGTLGFHTYLQSKGIAFDELQAQFINKSIFKKIDEETMRATKWLAEILGECEVTKGYGIRNSARTAIAPNMSSAILCGSVSQGIEPFVSNTFIQNTAAGEMIRVNPEFIKVLKKYGKYDNGTIRDINDNYQGSVQHLDWLSNQEKAVFKTAFEINQEVLVRLASQRQQHIDQGQSLNLFFTEDEEYVSRVVKQALQDPWIKGLYYQRSKRLTRGANPANECVACEG